MNLFTAFFYHGSEKATPYLIVTNCSKNQKDPVFTFLNTLMESEKEQISKYNEFILFTDGPPVRNLRTGIW